MRRESASTGNRPCRSSGSAADPPDARDYGAIWADATQDAEGSDMLALDTGGFTVRNTNDVARGIERIARYAFTLARSLWNVPRRSRPPLNIRNVPVKSAVPDTEKFWLWKKMSFCVGKSITEVI